MPEHRYDRNIVRKDLMLAAVGIVVLLIPLSQLWKSLLGWLILAPLFVLFSGFAWKSLERSHLVVRMDERGIHLSGRRRGRFIAWPDLARVRLRYYGRRKKSVDQGYLELTLSSKNERIRIESSIVDFREIVAETVEHVKDSGLVLDATTRANLAALGFEMNGTIP